MEKASALQWMNAGWRWCAKMAQSDQEMAMLAGRSPSDDEKAYVAAVASRKNLSYVGVSSSDVLGVTRCMETYRARKTKTSVQTPARWVAALTPNASKAVRMTRTVVQPW